MYGSTADMVIHPGVVHDVTAVKLDIETGTEPPPLAIDYGVAAEGARLIEAQEVLSGDQLRAECAQAY